MPPRRIFRFAYYTSQSDDLRRRIHQLRDGDAFSEVAAALYARGYVYGGLLLNLPPDEPHGPPQIDLSFLAPTDLLVINTRPPLHDRSQENKKKVPHSGSDFERGLFRALESYFEMCARSRIKLHERIARQLPEDFRERADIKFHEYTGGTYLKCRGFDGGFWQKPKPPGATAFYLVRIPAAWENGPGLLAAFGMSGTDTLVWNYLLRTRHAEWLESCEFLMAEVVPPPLPQHPTDLSFADDWQLTTVLRLPLPAPAARRNTAK